MLVLIEGKKTQSTKPKPLPLRHWGASLPHRAVSLFPRQHAYVLVRNSPGVALSTIWNVFKIFLTGSRGEFFTKIRACWIGCFIKYAAGFNRQNNPVSGLNQRLTCTIWLVLSPPGRYLRLLASSRCMHRYPSRNVWTQMYLMTLLGKKKAKQINTYLSIFRFNGSSLVREPGKKPWCIQKKSGLNTLENWNKGYLRNN